MIVTKRRKNSRERSRLANYFTRTSKNGSAGIGVKSRQRHHIIFFYHPTEGDAWVRILQLPQLLVDTPILAYGRRPSSGKKLGHNRLRAKALKHFKIKGEADETRFPVRPSSCGRGRGRQQTAARGDPKNVSGTWLGSGQKRGLGGLTSELSNTIAMTANNLRDNICVTSVYLQVNGRVTRLMELVNFILKFCYCFFVL